MATTLTLKRGGITWMLTFCKLHTGPGKLQNLTSENGQI